MGGKGGVRGEWRGGQGVANRRGLKVKVYGRGGS